MHCGLRLERHIVAVGDPKGQNALTRELRQLARQVGIQIDICSHPAHGQCAKCCAMCSDTHLHQVHGWVMQHRSTPPNQSERLHQPWIDFRLKPEQRLAGYRAGDLKRSAHPGLLQRARELHMQPAPSHIEAKAEEEEGEGESRRGTRGWP